MEKSSTLRRITKSKTFTLVLVFILVVVVFTIIKPTFLRPVNLRNIVNSATVSGITMVGLICLLISGNMDLSTGNVSVMSAIVMCTVSQMGAPWFLALLIGLLFGALCGAINAFLGYVCGIFPFIATLAMGTIWQGLGNFLTNAQNVVISDRSLWWLGSGEILGVPFAFVLMCVLMIVYGLILAKTKFGRTIYMMGGNFQAARLAGINLLAVLKRELCGDWDRLEQIVKLQGFVSSTPDFYEQPKVINGTSDLFVEVLGERGRHARTAVGTNVLPFKIPLEVEMIVMVKE